VKNSIYDALALPRLIPDSIGGVVAARVAPRPFRMDAAAPGLVGVVRNPRSRLNQGADAATSSGANVLIEAPETRAALRDVLAGFAARGIDLLVIDGGDGTIRDVLTCAEDAWGAHWPRIAILPAGKTNALAIDLGIPAGWTLDEAIAAATSGRVVKRGAIEMAPASGTGTVVRGFLLGAGGFVAATELAQHTHRFGAFNGLAVALAVVGAVGSTLFGRADNRWRRGSRMALRYTGDITALHGAETRSDRRRYMMLASTLERLPAGLKPFGSPRAGLKTLVVDAPPRQLATSVPWLLSGSEVAWLEERGYHRIDADAAEITLDDGFILDGEIFPGGAYTMRRGAPLRFVAP